MSTAATTPRGVPDASVARLPGYLRALTAMSQDGTASVSSEELASAAGVSSAMLRKDLSYLGSYGVRGVGYDVGRLASEIASALGLTKDWPVAIVGMGNLGRALAAYRGFAERGFRVIALLDHDDRVVGEEVAGRAVRPMTDLEVLVEDHGLAIGVIATPPEGAQAACDRLLAAGVRSVLNFAAVVLAVPPEVTVRNVDLSTELQILAFHGHRGDVAEAVAP
ncbi:redox-sensing transcriptional repressor Rex [Phycicoccus flavus]|uniref:redox-sensing transcriptional repressor Rex n=1 Tax=Phycicoccus flavus TaxID=2502783 RepID=UPI000FEC091D|nr:redox-sensing transcriptional repressor Rex [Phycicoccus flavus]NHA69748.1 redox-sensing transcriptional repressor Rex [Phycicoccus flavus]